MTTIISLTNEKGGVAKTTTAISLGAALAEQGQKILLIDLDAQANLTLALGVEPRQIKRSVASILMEGSQLAAIRMKTQVAGIDLVPSNQEIGVAERFLPTRPGYEYILRRAIEPVRSDYDTIIMDCPPFLGAVVLNALTASTMLIIPTQAEFFSIYALTNMMNLLRRVRAQYNPQLTYRLLLTMFDRRNRIHRTLSDQLQNSFAKGLLETRIEIDTKLRECPIAGQPIINHAPKSRAAIQYRALAQEIMQYVQETVAQPA